MKSLKTLVIVFCCSFFTSAIADAQESVPEANFSSPRVDFGIVVTDIEKAREFYTKALGLKETGTFTVAGPWSKKVGLSDSEPFKVFIMQAGEGDAATRVKLMQFERVRGSRPDNTFIHSTYGISYLTMYVEDLDASLAQAAKAGAKPIADGPQAIEANPELSLAILRDPDGNMIELVGPRAE
ncbi:VOC family protein [Stratiformator vulcanicus]|uniref:Glyoxalase-like domain protein n=1 Tax=Stratiformator vulcanicus TaxID=2527980 RepID=A0A517QXF9_9PLAN|nr:VOC family protein [Stratiformator vulcanicus]QDT36273.1 Glyoxalase-like domain protein [Stratiformator vulcanicus]